MTASDQAFAALGAAIGRRDSAVGRIARAEAEVAVEKAREELRRIEQEQLAAQAEEQREARARHAAHRAKRPERWAALPLLAKVLFVVASEDARPLRSTLIRIAQLLSCDPMAHSLSVVPEAFEREQTQ